jgi:hypothetical protein
MQPGNHRFKLILRPTALRPFFSEGLPLTIFFLRKIRPEFYIFLHDYVIFFKESGYIKFRPIICQLDFLSSPALKPLSTGK